MNNEFKNFNFGYFLKESHIKKGFLLLKKQINEDGYNFKTLEFEIFRNEKIIKRFNISDFYSKYIQKDLFYNYPSIFYNIEYSIPKGMYGIRSFNYLSFNMLILYYGFGFYILELIKDSLDGIKKVMQSRNNIHSFYGSKLNFENPENSELYYQDDYKKFMKSIKKFIEENINDYKISILKLDIKDFYHTINHNKLLEIIKKYSSEISIKNNLFDNDSIKSIIEFLFYLMGNNSGLPITNQNIVSNFISYLYLLELDNYLISIDNSNNKYSYHRYIDDFFIIKCYPKKTKIHTIGNIIFDTIHRISFFLKEELYLEINCLKTQSWIIKNVIDFEKFLNDSKFISFYDPDCNDIKIKFENIIKIIENLKKEYKKEGKIELKNNDDTALKECFVKSMQNYLVKKENKVLLTKLFQDWNPILTLNSAKAILFIISNSKKKLMIIEKFLRNDFDNKIKEPQYLYLLEKLLYNTEYKKSFKGLLKNANFSSDYFSLIKRMISYKSIDIEKSNISIQDSILNDDASLMQQVKKIILAEKSNDYNLAFNHLLNSFHLFCFIIDLNKEKKPIENYNRENVVDFLKNKKPINYNDIIFVNSFFGRRNKNTISHPGDKNRENWFVDENEYLRYKKQMIELIDKIK